MEGIIDRVEPERSFGFIRTSDGQEFFFHATALKATEFGELAPGVAVVFEAGREAGDQPGEHVRAVSVELAPGAIPAVDHENLPAEKLR